VKSRWAVLAVLCFARISIGFTFQSISVIGPFVVEDMHLNYADLGVLIGVYTTPGIFLALPGSLLAVRFGDKAVVLGSLGMLVIGALVVGRAPSYVLLSVGRIISGAGAVMLSVILTKIVGDWFAGKEISSALGILMSTWPVGISLALSTLGPITAWTSWRTAIDVTGAYSAFAFILVLLLYREPAPQAIRGPAGWKLWVISRRELGLMLPLSVGWMFLQAGFVIFMSFAPILLVSRGLSLTDSGFVVSVASLMAIPFLPIGGFVIDRTQKSNWVIGLGAAVSAVACLGVAFSGPAWFWVVLFGVVTAPPVAGFLALTSEALRPESRGTGLGVFQTANYLGTALIPPIAGFLLDLTNSMAAPIVLAGVCWAVALPALGALRLLQKRRPP
jgi:MFS family permease